MIKSLAELGEELSKIANTRYSHFKNKPDGDHITFIDTGTDPFYVDNKQVLKNTSVEISVYTKDKNEQLELALQELLESHDIPYDQDDTTYLQDEDLYVTDFNIELYN